jgi:hypothetical protein
MVHNVNVWKLVYALCKYNETQHKGDFYNTFSIYEMWMYSAIAAEYIHRDIDSEGSEVRSEEVDVAATLYRNLFRRHPVWILMSYRTIGVIGFDFRRGLGIFLFTTASRTALVFTQPPIQWVQGAFSVGVERPGREANHSPPSSAEVKECVELYLHSQYVFMAWCLVKHRGNFNFTFPGWRLSLFPLACLGEFRDSSRERPYLVLRTVTNSA